MTTTVRTVKAPVASLCWTLLTRFIGFGWLIAAAIVLIQSFVFKVVFSTPDGSMSRDVQALQFSVAFSIALFAIGVWAATEGMKLLALAGAHRRAQMAVAAVVTVVSFIVGIASFFLWNFVAQLAQGAGLEQFVVAPSSPEMLGAVSLLLLISYPMGILTGCLYVAMHWTFATVLGLVLVWPIWLCAIVNAGTAERDVLQYDGPVTGVGSFLEWLFSTSNVIAWFGLLAIPLALVLMLRLSIPRNK